MPNTSTHDHRWKYDVFVSFRGEDIRKSFMDHLFKDFKQKGIHAFRDSNDLPRGEEISFQLFKAIEESRFLIVIFSKNYASSSWCLRELVKILERKKLGKPKHEVRIIFYDVKPDVVRKQKRSYAEAFGEHDILNTTEVAKWKEALYMAANLSGWDLQKLANGYESKFIDHVSKEILKSLGDGPLYVGENLVGIETQVDRLNLVRFVGSKKVNMIGLCGISGIGKTTLSKAIYNSVYSYFEGSCFCDDVQGVAKREGLALVQMKLIDKIMKTEYAKISSVSEGIMVIKRIMACKPILLVLDDVDNWKQLEALAGSPNWFSPGSLIIFTSKDKQLLRSHKVEEIHDMEFLDDYKSLELFSSYAFPKKHPTNKYSKEVSERVVKYVQGHPLALKVLGCFLYGKTMCEWNSELDRLQLYPNEEIQKVLRVSYDGLNNHQRSILLDIACSLIGVNKDFAISILDSCNMFADTNLRVLADKSLITISSTTMSLQMHELIQAMTKEIIREESNMPGDRSRLWIQSEVYKALSENNVTEAVEVLVLLLEKSSQKVHIDSKAFARMKKLRILKIFHPQEVLHDFESKDFNVDFSGSFDFLSNELSLLYWHGCPFKFLPWNFYPEKIVAIDLSYSHLQNLWTVPKCFRSLKVIKLRYCRNLTSTPDFTEITNLEELYLDGCVNLVKVHPSIGMLKRLAVLDMRDCTRLRSFPCKAEMDSLQVLILSGCEKMDKLPEVLGTLITLVELHVDGTAITEFPFFIFTLINLQALSIGIYQRTKSRWWSPIFQKQPQNLVLPSLASFRMLSDLRFSNCNISEVSPDIGTLSSLRHLNLSNNIFTSLPGSLSQLSQLGILTLDGCTNLEVLPELPPNIYCLFANDCTALRELPGRLTVCRSFLSCHFIGCPNLFRNVTIESQVSMSYPRNQLSSMLQYM